tara:strand:- start:586 stop:1173 length:588 start_codon:yes stop_codon:yes gene_type:complete
MKKEILKYGHHVKISAESIDHSYTATIRTIDDLKRHVKKAKPIDFKYFGIVTNWDESASKEFNDEFKKIIEDKINEWLKASRGLNVWRNQATRDATWLGYKFGKGILIEYSQNYVHRFLNILPEFGHTFESYAKQDEKYGLPIHRIIPKEYREVKPTLGTNEMTGKRYIIHETARYKSIPRKKALASKDWSHFLS